MRSPVVVYLEWCQSYGIWGGTWRALVLLAMAIVLPAIAGAYFDLREKRKPTAKGGP